MSKDLSEEWFIESETINNGKDIASIRNRGVGT